MDKVNEFEFGIDQQSTNKQRFSDEANDHYRYPADEDLADDTETLFDYVKHHASKQRPRLDTLERYFDGKNVTILQAKRRKEEHYADNRASHNFAQYISTFIQGYMTGVPIKTEYVVNIELEDNDEKDENGEVILGSETEELLEHASEVNEHLQKLNRVNEADEHNSEMALDQSIYGRAYEYVFRNSEDVLRVVKLDPKDTFVIYSNDVEKTPVGAVRYLKNFNDQNKTDIWLYTKDEINRYEINKGSDSAMRLVDSKRHYFNDVPVVEYENNSRRTGDFESVLTLIDLYDSAQSDLANYSQDLNDALLLIEGNVKLKVSDASEMKKKNIMILRPAVNPQGMPEKVSGRYIYKQYDVAGMEAYKSRILNDIFLISNVPNLLDESFSGNKSGEALKMKLFGLAQKRATKERKFKKAIRKRYRLLKRNMEVASEMSFDVDKLQITFTENLPRAISQEIEWFSKLGGELSDETLLSLLSFIENPKEEIAKIMAEREENKPDDVPDFTNYLEEESDENGTENEF